MKVFTGFEELSRGVFPAKPLLLLLHFHAPACRVSRALSTILTELVGDYKGDLELRQINVEEFPTSRLIVEYEVLSVPTLILCCEGLPLARIRGFISKRKLKETIHRTLTALRFNRSIAGKSSREKSLDRDLPRKVYLKSLKRALGGRPDLRVPGDPDEGFHRVFAEEEICLEGSVLHYFIMVPLRYLLYWRRCLRSCFG